MHIYASFNDTTFEIYSYNVKIMIVDTTNKQAIVNSKYLDYSSTTTRHFTKALGMFGVDANIKQIRNTIQNYFTNGNVLQIQGFDILPIQ